MLSYSSSESSSARNRPYVYSHTPPSSNSSSSNSLCNNSSHPPSSSSSTSPSTFQSSSNHHPSRHTNTGSATGNGSTRSTSTHGQSHSSKLLAMSNHLALQPSRPLPPVTTMASPTSSASSSCSSCSSSGSSDDLLRNSTDLTSSLLQVVEEGEEPLAVSNHASLDRPAASGRTNRAKGIAAQPTSTVDTYAGTRVSLPSASSKPSSPAKHVQPPTSVDTTTSSNASMSTEALPTNRKMPRRHSQAGMVTPDSESTHAIFSNDPVPSIPSTSNPSPPSKDHHPQPSTTPIGIATLRNTTNHAPSPTVDLILPTERRDTASAEASTRPSRRKVHRVDTSDCNANGTASTSGTSTPSGTLSKPTLAHISTSSLAQAPSSIPQAQAPSVTAIQAAASSNVPLRSNVSAPPATRSLSEQAVPQQGQTPTLSDPVLLRVVEKRRRPTMDIATFPTPTLLSLLAALLTKVTELNDKIKAGIAIDEQDGNQASQSSTQDPGNASYGNGDPVTPAVPFPSPIATPHEQVRRQISASSPSYFPPQSSSALAFTSTSPTSPASAKKKSTSQPRLNFSNPAVSGFDYPAAFAGLSKATPTRNRQRSISASSPDLVALAQHFQPSSPQQASRYASEQVYKPTVFTSTQAALQTPNATLCFHARNIPSITIENYLTRISKYCPTTNEVFVSLLVYFDRMSRLETLHQPSESKTSTSPRSPTHTPSRSPKTSRSSEKFAVDSFNIHRLVISGITVASKFFSDVFYTNSRYAKVGGLPLAELNALELQFLLLNGFDLVITPEELQLYSDYLLLGSLPPLPSRNDAGLSQAKSKSRPILSGVAQNEDGSSGMMVISPVAPSFPPPPAVQQQSSFQSPVTAPAPAPAPSLAKSTPSVSSSLSSAISDRPKTSFRSTSESSTSASEGDTSTVVPSEDDSVDTERGGAHTENVEDEEDEEDENEQRRSHRMSLQPTGWHAQTALQAPHPPHPLQQSHTARDLDTGSASGDASLPFQQRRDRERERRKSKSRTGSAKRDNSRTREWTMQQRQQGQSPTHEETEPEDASYATSPRDEDTVMSD